MSRVKQSDESYIEQARRNLSAKRKVRWGMLFYACMLLGATGYCTFVVIRKVENLDSSQLIGGFVVGLGLAVVWTTLGVLGALFLAKFMTGFESEFRGQELLVCYHDRLRDLGQLPNQKKGEPGASADREDAASEL